MANWSFMGGLLLVVLGTSCKRLDPNYCPGANPNNNCLDIDAPKPPCTSSTECSPEVCDVEGGRCVECTPGEPGACTAASPVCGDDFSCRGCESHAECPASGLCLADGACADPGTVAYVQTSAPATDNTNCTRTQPCTKMASALGTMRPHVKLTGTINEATIVDGGQVVNIYGAPGSKLTRTTGNGAILTVQGDGTRVVAYDLAIADGTNTPNGVGVLIPGGSSPALELVRTAVTNNPAGGISSNGGTITVRQSTISGNTGGGIAIIGGKFDITNSFIVRNGGGSSLQGGVDITTIGSAAGLRFEFNTVTANIGRENINTGINCGTVTTPLTFSNNIIFNNPVSGGGSQVGGSANCLVQYSNVGPQGVSGTGNLNMNPMFASPGTDDFHLQAASPMRDAAAPGATLAVDFDNEPRPQGSGRDIGADEVP